MKREYNYHISAKANAWLNKRARIVRLQKCFIAIVSIIVISLIIILGSSIHAFARSKEDAPIYKYYTSIRIEDGDTLWDIAEKYTSDYHIDKEDYIEEVCKLNQIHEDEIHSGQYITIAYYSTEQK